MAERAAVRPKRILITTPHATCPLHAAGGPRRCDTRAREAGATMARLLQEMGMDVSVMQRMPVLRSETDANRDPGYWLRPEAKAWFDALHATLARMATEAPDAWVLDMHSFPAEGHWGTEVRPLHLVFLDLAHEAGPTREFAVLAPTLTDTQAWLPGSYINHIMRRAREVGLRSIIIEAFEDRTAYPSESMEEDFRQIARAIAQAP
jgi:hypothetical protein